MRTLCIFYFLFIVANAIGQSKNNTNAARYRVIYKLLEVSDTNKRQNVYTELKCLYINNERSEYFSYDKFLSDSIFQEGLLKKGFAGGIDMTGHKSYPTFKIFRAYNENKLTINEQIFDDYIYDDIPPKINWQLLNQIDSIGGYVCQKAIGRFRGRTYLVWFCPQLPLNAGPWKLNGLPGLILQAEDSTKSYKYEFVSFQSVTNGYKIEIPAKAIKTTKSEYFKLEKASDEDPTAFLKNSSLAGNVKNLQVIETGPRQKIVRIPPNNPIELSEQ